MKFRLFFISSLILLSYQTVLSVPEFSQEVKTLAHNLRCPVCQGLSVKESNTELSINMKNKIKELLDQGQTHDEVFDFFVQRYGEWILREPRKVGFNQFLWIAPYFFFILGVVLFTFIAFRYNKKKKRTDGVGSNEMSQLNEQEEKELQSIMFKEK